MKSRLLPLCCAAALTVCGGQAMAQTSASGRDDGPRLIGRGAALSPMEHLAYTVKTNLCPEPLRTQLVGGDMSDRDVVLIAVIVAAAVVIIVVVAAD